MPVRFYFRGEAVQFRSNQGRFNDLDEQVQGKFLKRSFLGSKMDNFFGDGVGASLVRPGEPEFHEGGLAFIVENF